VRTIWWRTPRIFPPLPTRDYNELAKWLNDRGLRPADLLTDSGREALSEVHQAKLERTRLEFLLDAALRWHLPLNAGIVAESGHFPR
jgi:hypothetical protein